MVGVIDMADAQAEAPETVAARIRAALEHVPAERVIVAPDCGMKYLSRELAFAKLSAMVQGADMVRQEIS
jgi:5-methyltetrahydropteroyltriglutamate--homocysteine methyltransferase